MAKPLFHQVTGHARLAPVGLLFLGLLWLAFGAVATYMIALDGADGFREFLAAYLLTLGIGAMLAMTLLAMRKRAGRVVAWIVLPFFLIFFPIGTIGGIVVIVGLHSEDMRVFLRKG